MCSLKTMFYYRLDKKLEEFEVKYSLPKRWLPSDSQYRECAYAVLLSKKEQLLLHIWNTAQRRMFLLDVKRKYAGFYMNDRIVCALHSQ